MPGYAAEGLMPDQPEIHENRVTQYLMKYFQAFTAFSLPATRWPLRCTDL